MNPVCIGACCAGIMVSDYIYHFERKGIMADPETLPASGHEATDTSIHFIREAVTELTKKIDAFFRRVDEHEKETGQVKTDMAVLKEKHIHLCVDFQKLNQDVYEKGGLVDRLRANENKLTRIYAIGGFAMTAIATAAILIPIIWK